MQLLGKWWTITEVHLRATSSEHLIGLRDVYLDYAVILQEGNHLVSIAIRYVKFLVPVLHIFSFENWKKVLFMLQSHVAIDSQILKHLIV